MKQFIAVFFLLLAACATTSSPPINKSKMAEGYYMKGLSHLQEKNYEMASVEFNRSIQTDDHYKQAFYGLGLISDYQGKLDDSEKYYQEAIDIDSDYSEAYNALGVVYFKQQKWKEAIKAFKKALENKLYTTPHIPYINLGDLYMTQKNPEKAIEAYRDAKRFVNSELTVYKLGTALFEAGRTKESVKEFQDGVELAPQNASFRYSLAIAYLKDGSKKAALAEFKKAAELAPGSEIALKAKDYIKTLR